MQIEHAGDVVCSLRDLGQDFVVAFEEVVEAWRVNQLGAARLADVVSA